ncbi:MAG: glycoside hydrolase family 28 protein [Oscillospiraceae bacterium]|nr:glycoside hydrolase family 28 protein [Oscillospiraceae bacterium]
MIKFTFSAVFTRSITAELINDTCYYAGTEYEVLVNDIVQFQTDKNVFSVYNLKPGTCYTVTVRNEKNSFSQKVTTLEEAVYLDVKRFGAIGDGVVNDTAMLQAAIMCCPCGGTVSISQGTYRVGALFLKSDITIEIKKGATLKGLNERRFYPVLPGVSVAENERDEYYLGSWEGNPLDSYASLITGINVSNVDIIGEGVLDADAQNGDWWENPKVRRGAWRPRMFYLKNCSDIRVQGVTFQNSYAWTLHPCFTQRLELLDIKVCNHAMSPNTDGIDPESCSEVKIIGAKISVGDDCIAIKSGKMFMGQKMKTPTQNVMIRNCLMERGHGGVVIGSEVGAGVNNITVQQCVLCNTDRGLRVKTRRGRGKLSILDTIQFTNVKMHGVLTPFVINMFYFCDPDGHSPYVENKAVQPIDDFTPRVGSLICNDVTCVNCGCAGVFIYGLPEQPVEKLEMVNVSIAFDQNAQPGMPAMMDGIKMMKKQGIFIKNIKQLSFENVTITGYEGEKMILDGVEDFREV